MKGTTPMRTVSISMVAHHHITTMKLFWPPVVLFLVAVRLRCALAMQPPVNQGWTAFGDSFAAGIGAGARIGGIFDSCRRREGSYPFQLDSTPVLSANPDHEFQFIACSGAVIANVRAGGQDSQIDQFTADNAAAKDIATLTISGNDVGFVNVLDACLLNTGAVSGISCQRALAMADLQIEAMPTLVSGLIADIIAASGSPIFQVFVTGYAQFFNPDTPECDNYSMGFWTSSTKLTSALRRSINSRVVKLNAALKMAVLFANNEYTTTTAFFVDYDSAFEGHRFCEDGVVEPDGKNTNTWFFLINGDDSSGFDTPDLEPPVDLSPQQCEDILNSTGSDWGEYIICNIQSALAEDPTLEPQPWTGFNSSNFAWVPESYGKVFHPKTIGHQAISQAIQDTIVAIPDLVNVLIFFQGTSDEFTTFIGSLPPTARSSRRIERETVSLRGYLTWLESDVALGLMAQNTQVVGVSYETTSVDATTNPPAAAAVDRRVSAMEMEINRTRPSGKGNAEPTLRKRDQVTTTDLNMQFLTPWHLKTISNPPQYAEAAYWKYPGYLFDPVGAAGVNLYILDSGINPNHAEFMALDLPKSFSATGIPNVIDVNYHGTCMSSCAAGGFSGTARTPTLIPVRFWSAFDRSAKTVPYPIKAFRLFECMLFILDDVITSGKKGKAVINYSNCRRTNRYAFPSSLFARPLKDDADALTPDEINESDPWFHFLPLFAANDVVVVVSAGNGGSTDDRESEQDSPRRYARQGAVGENSLIVIGATNMDNTVWSGSNQFNSIITTYAPGVNIQCASFDSNTDYRLATGTSLSTALTSGIVATYLARTDLSARLQVPNSVVANVEAFLKEAADYGSDTEVAGTVSHITSFNYVPCDNDGTLSERSEFNFNSSLVARDVIDGDDDDETDPDDDFIDGGSIGAQTISSTPIRRPGMLLTIEARATCIGLKSEPPQNWEYLGCFVDQESPNGILNGASFSPAALTIESCSTLCSSFTYFGVEAGNQCFCGNSAATTNQVPNGECNVPCAGNIGEACGVTLKMNLYHRLVGIASVSSSPVPTPSPSVVCTASMSCDGCSGAYLPQSNNATCRTTQFLGCPCEPTNATCGPSASCDSNGCAGTYDPSSNTARCRNNFAGCVCSPTADTCSAAQSCESNNCSGAVGTDGKATCKNAFAGCTCLPSINTPGFLCGSPQSCELNGCAGTSVNGQNSCKGVFAGCTCVPSINTPGFACGNPQSCELNNCAGTEVNDQITCKGSFAGCACLPSTNTPGFTCGTLQSCQLNGCAGTQVNGQSTCKAAFAGCACVPGISTPGFSCGNPQSCELNNCAGTQVNGQSSCKNAFAGCTCLPTINTPGFSCGNAVNCQLNGCAGTLVNGQSTCKGAFAGCTCLPGINTPGFSCGNVVSCELNNCAGTQVNGQSTCKNAFQGCTCLPSIQTPGFSCGNAVNCQLNNCDGTLVNGVSTCKNAFAGCTCLPGAGTPGFSCGNAVSCELNNCAGTQANGQSTCKNAFAGCTCLPSVNTPGFSCGTSVNCQLNNCAGTRVNGLSTCKNAFAGCSCLPGVGTPGFSCGNAVSCQLNSCAGTVVNGQATCKNAFAGCTCIPSTQTPGFTCGNAVSCELNNCGGTVIGSTAKCKNAFAGCTCLPSPNTPGFCGPLGLCSFSGCNGINVNNQGICQAAAHRGCLCVLPSAPPPPPPPPSQPSPPAQGSCADDCLSVLTSKVNNLPDQICTDDASNDWVDFGNSDGTNVQWFRLASFNNCFLVLAKSGSKRGFSDGFCFPKSYIQNWVQQNALGCNSGDAFFRPSPPLTSGDEKAGQGEVCLSNFDNYLLCGVSTKNGGIPITG